MSLVANGIEARGIPTLVIGTVRDIMEQSFAPRSVFVDFPVGRTFGQPGASEQHRQALAAALRLAAQFTAPGEILDLPLAYAGADRSWEEVVRNEVNPRRT